MKLRVQYCTDVPATCVLVSPPSGKPLPPCACPNPRPAPAAINAVGVTIPTAVQNHRRGCRRTQLRQGCSEMHDALGDGQWEHPKLRLFLENGQDRAGAERDGRSGELDGRLRD